MFWRRRRQEPGAAPDEAAEPTAGQPSEQQEAERPPEANVEPPPAAAESATPPAEPSASPPPADVTGPDRASAAAAEEVAEPPAPRSGPLWGPGIGEPPPPVAPAWSGASMVGDTGRQQAMLAEGLQASRRGFMTRLHGIFGAGAVDPEAWEEVEETLIAGDVGARLAMDVVERARKRNDPDGPEAAVRVELERLLPPTPPGPWRPARPDPAQPAVVLVVGVNGTGKTTSIAKIAARLTAEGDDVILAAADTFRAAAIEQLEEWARRLSLPVVAHKAGADPSAVVYDALDAAVARGSDVVIVDTAGRLHTRHNLMEELGKIRRTIDRRIPGAEPEVLFVLDATTGQNGLAQAKAFHETSQLTGIVLTKLDSTAKGGIVFAIEQALAVPVVFAGVGEKVGDLVDFDPRAFVEALFG